ncbi:hypothetical protein [Citrifermentans bremense]|uniref:hypothetical protein n=1 Tax=Citrifermentans bremense TaxID=60035 RepID=UPI001626B3E4|nr:hypothetical protein [Citrifermentans bremense]
MTTHMHDFSAFREVGSRMLAEWEVAVDLFIGRKEVFPTSLHKLTPVAYDTAELLSL